MEEKNIPSDFAKDGARCYARGKRIAQAHAASFTIVEHSYFAFDNQRVYAISDAREGLIIVEGLDTSALFWVRTPPRAVKYFSTLHDLYEFNYHFVLKTNESKFKTVRRKDDVLPFGGRRFSGLRDVLLLAYPDIVGWWHPEYPWHRHAEAACGNAEQPGYYSHGNASFYLEALNDLQMVPHYLPSLPAASRQDLNSYYAKSDTQVFFKSRPIAADSASFAVIDGLFACDSQNAYFNGYPVVGADASTLRPVYVNGSNPQTRSAARYAKCSRQVYAVKFMRTGKFQGYDSMLVPLAGADPASFEVLNYCWAKDRHRVFEDGVPKAGRCAADFHIIAEDGTNVWATDSCGLYNANGRRVVKGAEAGNFKVLNAYWFSNRQQVFSALTERLMPSIDAATFEILDDQGGAQDKDHIFSLHTPKGWEGARPDIRKRKRPPAG